MTNVVGILLAAGQSSRFGSNKLLYTLDNGKTIAEQSALNLIAACPNGVAVVADKNSTLSTALHNIGFNIVENSQPQLGMASSIACGVNATPDADAWLIALADMPFISSKSIATIVATFNQSTNIIRPQFQDQPGYPVLFGHAYYHQLLALHGDTGARDIIDKHKSKLISIEVADAGIIKDIDLASDTDC